MGIYDFTLRFRLPESGPDPAGWLDALYEKGCDDATVGLGRSGFLALMFAREAPSAAAAVSSAVRDVKAAIPGAELVAADPDLVNLAELAELVGCTRQNMRKYAAGEIRSAGAIFPPPAISGHESFWRLAEVAAWMTRHAARKPDRRLIEIASTTCAINLELQKARLRALQVDTRPRRGSISLVA